ncbi:GMC oxidoreductase [Rhizobium sophoriradicis]|uniref:Glucose-methanol-choline oxidoreductase N-terminal domain-containing protein n=1 Tax=Rhizobium sophoriradicis TaxID=1535245 RepID=A0A2A5KN93_9HYPH|nr:GMC oxidoreductase [Rhizobium sophoriradicis]PCK78482.1 hypothetical protein CPT34_24730 [Rhizobium sophoriradicis]
MAGITATDAQQATTAAMLAAARDPATTPFDYIVIGSGAGGGPLAARLALSGRRVLVIEAGSDPAIDHNGKPREVYDIPAYNGAATEDPATSWDFSVRHYEDDQKQRADSKYDPTSDPSQNGDAGKGGVFYPRAAALGGCTSHHAMIIIRPNDSDWDGIARFTGDDSWRSENMQGYFPKIEECLYYKVYKGFLGNILGGLLGLIQAIATFINPRRHLDPNGHGFKGWQPTSFIDPLVIAGVARGDRTFLGLIFNVLWSALSNKGERSILKRALAHLQIIQFLDPNVRAEDIKSRARLSLISIGTDGRARRGLREWLLDVASRHPDRLVLKSGAHATRLIFDAASGETPTAIGVEAVLGKYLYRASKRNGEAAIGDTVQYFARREVIVCGGSFNSPQLLMLSGIGDARALKALEIEGPRDKDGTAVAPVVDLTGVGANLQDRYEVSIVSEMKNDFSTLKGATFQPGDPGDPLRSQWLADGTGLYGTNGGALAMMRSSSVGSDNPDFFVFGVPAAFRGYYRGWSTELLKATQGAAQDQRNLWTWVILKAYTDNNAGTVKLRSRDAFDTPEINFHSFSEGPPGHAADLDAICETIRHMREINSKISGVKAEIQPGSGIAENAVALRQWVQDEAWGHHACGTCRIGTDPWRAKAAGLRDRNAVLDSAFRVHGIRNLRVVDASVFPRIPGYFIVTPIFMIAEKAADAILADPPIYPSEIEQREAAAVHLRRNQVDATRNPSDPAPTSLPEDCVGVALSGGGIRSATYALGVLQALAATRILRRVDFLSSASGGGYAAGFLGRLFTRIDPETPDRIERIEAVIADPNASEIWWLRRYADYLIGNGRSDVQMDVAIIARNIAAVLFCVGALFLGCLGLLRWLSDRSLPAREWTIAGVAISPWWIVSAAVLLLAVLPIAASYWLTPSTGSRSPYSRFGALGWAVLLGCAFAAFGVDGFGGPALLAVTVLLLAWLWHEAVRWRIPAHRTGSGAFATLYRNRLSRALGSALLILVATVGFVLLDSAARFAAGSEASPVMAGSVLAVPPILLLLRPLARWLFQQELAGADAKISMKVLVAAFAFAFAAFLIFTLDVLAHSAFERSLATGAWMTLSALAVSLAAGQAVNFLNLSSLQQLLTQKVTRTFLGASNRWRVHPTGTDAPVPIQVSDDDDDVDFDDYHPEQRGGPLHLVNVCINQTVDHISGRQLRENKGLAMCLGPGGISVGPQYHAVWEARSKELAAGKAAVRALPVAPDPHKFHVLGQWSSDVATVERLTLGRWLAISAASLSTGAGRNSSLPQSLMLGLLNVRLGYWWDSGINADQRPGRYPPGLWRRIKSLPAFVFSAQGMLLNEWRNRFQGPSARRWYLSDGGHFDNTGLYELIRRRLPFIIAVDASQDENYDMGDLATLMRQVRVDFNAEFAWLDPGPTASAKAGWQGIDSAARPAALPDWIKGLVCHPERLGSLAQIKRDGPACGALARVDYRDAPGRNSWLLLIKANLAPALPADVRNYAVTHESFPHQATIDQFFDDDQWESYRSLGVCAGKAIFEN